VTLRFSDQPADPADYLPPPNPAPPARELHHQVGHVTFMYSVYRDVPEPAEGGEGDRLDGLVECWPRDMEGAIYATHRAAHLSIRTEIPHEVRRPNGTLLARFVVGRRVDLEPV
jgi:hypothetical protein